MNKMQNTSKWNALECALLAMLAACLLVGAAALKKQDQLQQKMIRLHVVANSDSDRDQALKLQVRDKVLAFTERTMRASDNRAAANAALQTYLPVIERMAEETLRENGCWDSVEVRLESTEFPLKAYNGFRLPAREYRALRVPIGEAAGQNWWCVVFPPLCTTASVEVPASALEAGLSEEEVRLITEENTGYVLKFKAVEWWQQAKQMWSEWT